MVESNTSSNLFNLSDNAISALKKANLVQQIINLREKVIVDSDLRNLCDQISDLSETITKLVTTNQQMNSELTIVKVVNSKLEKRETDLEKNQAKSEQYSRRNIVKFEKPTRLTVHSKALTDNIFCNLTSHEVISGNIIFVSSLYLRMYLQILHQISLKFLKETGQILIKKKLATANQQMNSELAIVKLVNSKLEKRETDLEKNQAKSEQYSRRNNVEFSNIPNDIPNNQLESMVIQICRELSVEVDHNDIECCHRLPVSRYSQSDNKRVIVKFVNRKHSETLFYKKKSISSKDFSNIKYIFVLCH